MKDECRYYDPTQEYKCTFSKWGCRYWSCNSMAVCPNWKPKEDKK